MDRDNIKKVWAAFVEVQEGKKKKLDKVDKDELEKDFKDREDKDIDNDGDEDESDEYLHNRRKTVKKAIAKEEVEQIDEIGDTLAGKKKLKNLIVNRTQKAVDAGASLERKPEKAAQYDKAQKRHMKTIGRAAERLAKEEVEQVDEVVSETPHPQTHVMASAAGSNDVHLWKHIDGKATPVKRNLTTAEAGKLQRNHGIKWVRHGAQKYFDDLKNVNETWQSNMDKASKKAHADAAEKRKKMGPVTSDTLADINAKLGNTKPTKKNEEVELDELSKDTLASYHKKSVDAQTAALRSNDPKELKKIGKRLTGAGRAYDRMKKMKEQVEIMEAEMTDAQMKKREEYVKSMKSKASEFKDKYGDRWKDVMYATATKMAMKEDVMENKQTAGATAPESMEDKFTASDKKFVQAHGGLQHAAEVDGVKAAADTAAAIKASEPGENHANRSADKSQGDKNVVPSATKVKEAKDLDQLMRILANK